MLLEIISSATRDGILFLSVAIFCLGFPLLAYYRPVKKPTGSMIQTNTEILSDNQTEFTGKKPEPVISEPPGIGERIDVYLLRQLNANPNSYAVAVIDACKKVSPGNPNVTRFQLPGIAAGFGIDLILTVMWEDQKYEFAKRNGRWSNYETS